MKDLGRLYTTFFKIGITTFGGGLSMLPMLERELVENNKWVTNDEIMDYFAIGQCTPGIIAVNCATFVGYKIKGVLGGIVATLGMISPSILIISIVAMFLSNLANISYVQNAFGGIRVAVCALVLNTVYKMFKANIKSTIGFICGIIAFILSFFIGVSPVIIVLIGTIIGLINPISTKEGEK